MSSQSSDINIALGRGSNNLPVRGRGEPLAMSTLYRAAALAYRKAGRIERPKGLKADPHIPPPLRAAGNAVLELRKGLSDIEAETFVQKALAWVEQAHNACCGAKVA